MADTKISALTAAGSALAADEFAVNEAGTSKKVTGTQLLALFGDSMGNQSTATQAPTAATLTYLTGSNIAVPVGKLRVGTVFVWRVDMTKTAAGIAARTFHVRLGTAGTTGDAAILTFTSALGTAAVDQAWMQLIVTIRGPLSASCIARGYLNFDHEGPATGFMTVKSEVLGVTSGVFDATVANLIIGLSVTTGASEVITFQQVVAEAKNL
jgi:hypothetical protein